MKHVSHKVLALLLATAMILPATACKKSSSNVDGNSGSQKNNSGSTVKTGVISEDDPFYEYKEVKLDPGSLIDPAKKLSYSYYETPFFIGDHVAMKYTITYEIPEELLERISEYEARPDADYCSAEYQALLSEMNEQYQYGMLIFDQDGKVINQIQTSENEGINSISSGANGEAYMLVYSVEPGTCVSKSILRTIGSNGETKKEIELKDGLEEMWDPRVVALDNGNFVFICYNGFFLADADGKCIKKLELENYAGNFYQQDGKYYVLLYEFDNKTNEDHFFLQEMDVNSFALVGSPREVDNEVSMIQSGGDGLYTIDQEGVNRYDLEKDEFTLVLDWNDTDANRTELCSIYQIKSEDEFNVIGQKYYAGDDGIYQSDYSLVHFTRCAKNPHAGKTIINAGVMDYVDESFAEYVREYNMDPNGQARIRMLFYYDEYSIRDGMSQNASASDKLYLDMLAGEGPDILVNFSAYSQFNNEEILVDLNQYLDGPNGIKREEYFDNILRAFESNGKLYHLPAFFALQSYAVNADRLGDTQTWNYDEFDAIASQVPEDMSVFYQETKDSLMSQMLIVSGSTFVDYEKKETHFDSDAFKKLLEIANKYGVDEIEDISYGSAQSDGGIFMPAYATDDYVSDFDMMDHDMLLMLDQYIGGIEDYARAKGVRKGNVRFMGLPTADQNGQTATATLSLAISTMSKNQEIAWDFVSYMLLPEKQLHYTSNNYCLALHRNAMAQQIDKDIELYEKAKAQYDSQNQTGGCYCGEIIDYEIKPGMKEEMISLIEQVTNVYQYDPQVAAIVEEEAAAYFAGQRSADDVCKNIQNRVQNLVQER